MTMGPRNRARIALLVGSTLVALILMEGFLRFFYRENAFRDRRSECFWVLRRPSGIERIRGWWSGVQGPTPPTNLQANLGMLKLDPILGWRMSPHIKLPLDKGAIHTNARGLRGKRDWRPQPLPGISRIVVLGDWTTFGPGVRYQATFPSRLQGGLADTQVINLGTYGYGPDQQYLFWLEEGARYRPDMVVLAYSIPAFHRIGLCMAESTKPCFSPGLRLRHPRLPPPRAYLEQQRGPCATPSRVGDLVAAVWRRLNPREAESSFDAKAQLNRELLAALRQSVEEEGAELALVIVPHGRFRDYPDHLRIESALESAARDERIPLLNLTEPFYQWQQVHPDSPLYTGPHGDWTIRGHDEAAKRILTFLKSVGSPG